VSGVLLPSGVAERIEEEGHYICDHCQVHGVGHKCWYCESAEFLWRGTGAKWPGPAGSRRPGEPPYVGGQHRPNQDMIVAEPDVTWIDILDDVNESASTSTAHQDPMVFD
jgi:hypothetical protein